MTLAAHHLKTTVTIADYGCGHSALSVDLLLKMAEISTVLGGKIKLFPIRLAGCSSIVIPNHGGPFR